MITFKTITLRNFLSTGAVTQTVNLNTNDLTLVLGENLDAGGSGARNGVGKSTILQALHYVLFNISINNNIRKDNLCNKTNEKNMLVTLQFSVDGVDYEIRRGRKPGVLQFFVDNKQQEVVDGAQGESRETQREIERILNLTPELFTQLTLLSTYTTPFLALKSNEQRVIIESLLGISQLSERAELIKERIRATKDEITQEEYSIKATIEANRRITEQIDSLLRRQKLWQTKHSEDLNKLVTEYDDLSKIDIVAELQAHRDLTVFNINLEISNRRNALVARQTAWRQKLDGEIAQLETQYKTLNSIDIDTELAAHAGLVAYNAAVVEQAAWAKAVAAANKQRGVLTATVTKLTAEVRELTEHRCYACGQEFHDERHTSVLTEKQRLLEEAQQQYDEVFNEWRTLSDNPITVPTKPTTHYATEAEAVRHSSKIANIVQQIEVKRGESDPYSEQIAEHAVVELGTPPRTHYDTEEAAFKHSSRVESLLNQITVKHSEVDPYSEQIAEMTATALVEVSYDHINVLNKRCEHEKFLLDLLTNKDSFVRKRIIDQNLQYLNNRLQHYLDRLRLAHTVQFKNNLEVDIQEFGRELDFGNLSRGEQNRVILALSFAFRDLYENLFHTINGLYVDELIDSGMDTSGVECSVALLKEMSRSNRSVFLISHREELVGRVNTVLKVIKEGGFTSYETE